jgi:predicted Zn-dependent peptidase
MLTAEMLREGAGGRGALEFSDALEQLGASLGAGSSQEFTYVNLSVLKRNIDKALDLYADAILRPRFDESEWDRVKTLHLQDLKRAEDRPESVAAHVGMRTFFGDDHPYGRPADGTTKTVESLTINKIKDCYKQLFQPSDAVIFIAGDLTADEAKAALEKRFGAWKPAAGAAHKVAAKMPPHAANQKLKVVLVDKPEAVQTVIRFYMPGPIYKNPDRVKLELLNTILGGSFTSRLNQNLREDHGYTYGARTKYEMEPSTGYFIAAADVQAEHTGEALKEFLAEFKRARKGDISKDEAAKSRETNRNERVESFQGLGGLLSTAVELEENGLPFSTVADDLKSMTVAKEVDLNHLASSAIPLEQAVLVLVGDKKLVTDQLKGLELPAPVELTVRGDAK